MERGENAPEMAAAAPSLDVPSAPGPFAYIDLARFGRTDWRSGLKGLFKIIGWYLLVNMLIVVPIYFYPRALPINFIEVLALGGLAAAWWLGLRGAVVKSQQRPLRSLVSAERRWRLSRIATGAALWLAAAALVALASALLQAAVDPASFAQNWRSYAWPKSGVVIAATLLCLVLFPFQAAGEELVFRGWLTQTLGQYVRWRWAVALIVALLFALCHGFAHGIAAFPVYVVMSLGLSALTLLDGRIELAIGVHAINNMAVVIAHALASTGVSPTLLLFDQTQVGWGESVQALAQFALIYAAARWLIRRDTHAIPGTDISAEAASSV